MNTERNTKGHWTKGSSGNPGGRPRIVEDVRAIAMEETPASIRALVKIRDNAKAPAQARVAAANSILDRALGKPIQATVSYNQDISEMLDQINGTRGLPNNRTVQ